MNYRTAIAKTQMETKEDIMNVLINTIMNPTYERCKEAYKLSGHVRRRARDDWESMEAPLEHIKGACLYALKEQVREYAEACMEYQKHVTQSRIFEQKFPTHQLTEEEMDEIARIDKTVQSLESSTDAYNCDFGGIMRQIDRLKAKKHCITGTYDPNYFDLEW